MTDYDKVNVWISTLPPAAWNNMSPNVYWKNVFGADTLWDETTNTLNESAVKKLGLTGKDIVRSCYFLNNTIASENPLPALWGLKHLKILDPQSYAQEYTLCFSHIVQQHPHLTRDFLRLGGVEGLFEKVCSTVLSHHPDLIVDVLENFPFEGNEFPNTGKWQITLSRHMGIIDGKLLPADKFPTIPMDWFFLPHVQQTLLANGGKYTPLNVWEQVLAFYPDPRVADLIEKTLHVPHLNKVAMYRMLEKILRTPVNEQRSDLLEHIAQNPYWLDKTTEVVFRASPYSSNEVVKKILSQAPAEDLYGVFDKLLSNNFHPQKALADSEMFCQFVDASLHESLIQHALKKVCAAYPTLANHLQNMVLTATLNKPSSSKTRKM